MFNKLKQLKELKQMKDSLSEEKVEVEKQGIKIVLNGNFEIEQLILNSEIEKEQQESILKDCLNEGVRKIQMSMVEKFKGLM